MARRQRTRYDWRSALSDPVTARVMSAKMQWLTFLAVFGFAWLFFPFAWLRSLMTDRHLNRLARQVWRTTQAVGQVEAGTAAIQEAVARMDEQTTRMQRLAITIGVVTGLVGAMLGGFPGAFAAHVIG
jgi:hypothetical protein